jgi:hypothetical protein
MKWPRGKYNGKRIVGIRFGVQIDITAWVWMPHRIRFANAVSWLCFIVRLQWEYEF